MTKLKGKRRLNIFVVDADAAALRRLANKAGVSVSRLCSVAAELLARKGRAGSVGLTGALLDAQRFVTVAPHWQEEIDGVSPCSLFLELDVREGRTRFARANRSPVHLDER